MQFTHYSYYIYLIRLLGVGCTLCYFFGNFDWGVYWYRNLRIRYVVPFFFLCYRFVSLEIYIAIRDYVLLA